MNKILIVGPAWVGDMVMAQCLFKVLREKNPHVIIDVLAPQWSLPLLKRMPEVANAIIMPIGHGRLALQERYQIGKSLRANFYDQAIVLANSFKSALIPLFARIPQRTGWLGEMRFGLLNDIYYQPKRYELMIERFMVLGYEHQALKLPYPLPELLTSAASQNQALARHHLVKSSQPILVLCPGAEFGPAKRWPETHYAAIAKAKLAAGWQVWLLGSAKDEPVTAEIMQLTQQACVDLAGKTQLETAIDLLSLADMVVSNDSGLMHIAAALQRPLIALYGPTSKSFTPPLNPQAKMLGLNLACQPCRQRVCPLQHHKCMQDLLPEQVLRKIDECLI